LVYNVKNGLYFPPLPAIQPHSQTNKNRPTTKTGEYGQAPSMITDRPKITKFGCRHGNDGEWTMEGLFDEFSGR
jgi:hypothetical protein